MKNLRINFLARAKNRLFWMAFIPAVILLVQMVAALFGFNIDLTEWQGKLLAVVDALFGVFVVLGVVVDPTTEGVSDSVQAMTYAKPRKSDDASA